MLRYRPDIDGLRAVAVLPIVLFHAGYDWLSGGFIGVDIFFVISGFLISSIVLDEISAKQFSFIRFYERRARRIVPALFAMLLCTVVAGYFFLLPAEYMDLGRSSLAALAFIPNIYFWNTASTYFGLDVVTAPLLHTWSLGVEEQFYLIFPLIFFALAPRLSRPALATSLSCLLLASLALNILAVEVDTKFAFYMLPTRAWELLLGSLLSLHILPKTENGKAANLIALSGLGLIIYSLLTLSEDSVFPGANAIPPVLGTALIIHTGSHHPTLVTRFLSNRLLVAIGAISYSLYLWHWPVTVYTNLYWESVFNRPLIIAISFLLAFLSFRFVEQRYRKRSGVTVRRNQLLELLIPLSMTTVIATVVIFHEGLPQRIPESAWQAAASQSNYPTPACIQFSQNADLDAEICPLGKESTEPRFVVWGDSHAGSVATAVHMAAIEKGVSGVLISSHGCRPILGVYRKGKHRCEHFNDEVIEYIYQHPSLKNIFLAGYWRVPYTAQGYDNSNYLIMDRQTRRRSAEENARVFRRGLERTLLALEDYRTIIIQDVPEIGSQFGKSVQSHYIRRSWLNQSNQRELIFNARRDLFEKTFRQSVISPLLNTSPDRYYAKLLPLLCENEACPLLREGRLIYSDGDHLSGFGASLLTSVFLPYF